MRIRSITKHALQAFAEGSLIALLIVGLMAGSAFAARGGGKPSGGGTINAVLMVTDANGNGSPNHLDDITFDVSTTATAYPQVGLRCWQGTNFVYDAYVGYWAAYNWDRFFRLSSGYWNPELAATCTARLFYNDSRGREKILTTLSVAIAP